MKKEVRAYFVDQLPQKDQYEIAFIGRSNCGKSSLINTLCGTYNAKVSRTPGHTLWLGIHEVSRVRLIDLPGYGYAATSRSRKDIVTKLVWDYLDSKRIDMIFVLIDTRRGVLEIDKFVIEAINSKAIPIKFIGTKVDKKRTIKEGLDFYCSSLTRSGIEEIKGFIKSLAA